MILGAVLFTLAIAVGVIAYLLWQLDTARAELTKSNASAAHLPGSAAEASTKGV